MSFNKRIFENLASEFIEIEFFDNKKKREFQEITNNLEHADPIDTLDNKSINKKREFEEITNNFEDIDDIYTLDNKRVSETEIGENDYKSFSYNDCIMTSENDDSRIEEEPIPLNFEFYNESEINDLSFDPSIDNIYYDYV